MGSLFVTGARSVMNVKKVRGGTVVTCRVARPDLQRPYGRIIPITFSNRESYI
jgi:hypothetical protein